MARDLSLRESRFCQVSTLTIMLSISLFIQGGLIYYLSLEVLKHGDCGGVCLSHSFWAKAIKHKAQC